MMKALKELLISLAILAGLIFSGSVLMADAKKVFAQGLDQGVIRGEKQ
jgi:hypothetical protein